MDNRLQATFIPRRPAVSGDSYARPKGPPNILMIVGVGVFLLVAIAFGGLYFYKNAVTKSNEQKKAQIEQEIANFEPELTRELTVLKNRIDSGRALLQGHRAFSFLFSLLELNTAKTVRFTNLSYAVTPEKKIDLVISGEAGSYNAIAFQSDIFSKIKEIQNPIFSNLSMNELGIIKFSVAAQIDPSLVAYKKFVANSAPAPATQSSSAPVATTTAPVTTATTTPSGTSTPIR